MSIVVNKETCIGCGTCVSLCPSGFKMNDDGKSEPITQENLECVKQAVDSCPVKAITVS